MPDITGDPGTQTPTALAMNPTIDHYDTTGVLSDPSSIMPAYTTTSAYTESPTTPQAPSSQPIAVTFNTSTQGPTKSGLSTQFQSSRMPDYEGDTEKSKPQFRNSEIPDFQEDTENSKAELRTNPKKKISAPRIHAKKVFRKPIKKTIALSKTKRKKQSLLVRWRGGAL